MHCYRGTEKGVSVTSLAKKFAVAKSTICIINTNKNKIKNSVGSN